MKKLIFGIAALFMMSIVLVGCNDKKSKKDKDDKDDDDERTEQVAEDDEDDEDGVALFDSAPEKKMVSLLEDALSLMKRTHIRTQDDVTELAEKMGPIKEKVEAAITEMTEAYKDKDLKELEDLFKDVEAAMDKISKEAEKEGDRLQKEAEEAGVDLSALEALEIL